MDVGTGIALFGPSALTLKLLGPTADYIGDGARTWTESRVANVQAILRKAESKVTETQLSNHGAVAPRVLRGIVDDGSFFEDELSQDYLGGLLASSHSDQGRDDRAATYIDLLARLSTYQIRTHYVLYRAAQRLCATYPSVDLSSVAGRNEIGGLFVRFPPYLRALELSDDELGIVGALVNHAFVGLHREGLIATEWRLATDPEDLRRMMGGDTRFPGGGGIVFGLSMFGIELYSAAHGLSGQPSALFSGPSERFDKLMSTDVPEIAALRVAELESASQTASSSAEHHICTDPVPRVTLVAPPSVRPSIDGHREVTGVGWTVGDILADICRQHPAFAELFIEGGLAIRDPTRPRAFALFLNGEEIRYLDGLETEVSSGGHLSLVHGFSAG